MSQKKVSVCINTYNLEKYIAQALDSVFAQKVNFDYEIVIGDDGSTDSTRKIIETYKKNYPEIIRTVYQEQNKGRLVNLFQTLIACKYEYIAFLDGDDYWINPNKLQRQVDFLNTNLQYAGVIHDSTPVDENSSQISGPEFPILTSVVLNHEKIVHIEGTYAASTLLFRKECLDNYPKWFVNYANIWQLNLVITRKKPLIYWEERLAAHRVHDKGFFTRLGYFGQQERKVKTCQKLLSEHIFNGKYDQILKNRIGVLAFQIAPIYKNEDTNKYKYYKKLYAKYGFKLHGFRFFHNYIFHILYPEMWKRIKNGLNRL